jgi:hypothetical protein
MLLMVTALGKIAPKYGTLRKSSSLQYAAKISAEMLVKQNNIFNTLLVSLCNVQIGRQN